RNAIKMRPSRPGAQARLAARRGFARLCVILPLPALLRGVRNEILQPRASAMTKNSQLESWVREVTQLCQPERVVWCDGSDREYQAMLRAMVQGGTALWLDSSKRPNSVFVRSD